MKLLQIDFGGGEPIQYPNFKKCDILNRGDIEFGGVDFNKDRLPFSDDSVDEAVCSHCLEHIVDTKHFLNELHRTLKPSGTITFYVPHGLWNGSFNPVHVNQITESWFDFLQRPKAKKIYGYEMWKIMKMNILTNKAGEKYEIICIMKKQ